MEEIARFVLLVRSARFTITDLCEQFGISCKTAYKHLERFEAAGMKGLQARSHRPHTFPQRTDQAVEALVLAERRLHRTWGPKKLQRVLEVKHGIEAPPACSTIGEMLRRHGLSVRRRRRPGVCPSADHGTPFASVGLGRLSSLSVWWIQQGIEVEFTRPAMRCCCP